MIFIRIHDFRAHSYSIELFIEKVELVLLERIVFNAILLAFAISRS